MRDQKITNHTLCTMLVRLAIDGTTVDATGSPSKTQLKEIASDIACDLGFDYVPAFVTRTVKREANK